MGAGQLIMMVCIVGSTFEKFLSVRDVCMLASTVVVCVGQMAVPSHPQALHQKIHDFRPVLVYLSVTASILYTPLLQDPTL